MEFPAADYEFLGLPPDATVEELRRVRLALLKEFHPDRFTTEADKQYAHEQTIRLIAACERIEAWLRATQAAAAPTPTPETESEADSGAAEDAAPQPSPQPNESAEARRAQEEESRRREREAREEVARKWTEEESDTPPPEVETTPQRSANARWRLVVALGAVALLLWAAVAGMIWGWRLGSKEKSAHVPEPETPAAPMLTSTGPVVAIAAGASHAYALRRDGAVVGWGRDEHGETAPPADLSDVIALAAGEEHGLAVRRDGTVVSWGRRLRDFPHRGHNKVVLRPYNVLAVPADLRDVAAVAAGQWHNLALTRAGRVVGWGDNYENQAQPPAGLDNVVAIAAGSSHSLALRRDGTLIGWGRDKEGQAQPPVDLGPVASISANGHLSAAVTRDGRAVVWGGGVPADTNRFSEPLPPLRQFTIHDRQCFAVTIDGRLLAWLRGAESPMTLPVSNVVAVAQGEHVRIALDSAGVVWRFGLAADAWAREYDLTQNPVLQERLGLWAQPWRGFRHRSLEWVDWSVTATGVVSNRNGGDNRVPLLHPRRCRDFDLSFEWRGAPGSRGGLLYHVDETVSSNAVATGWKMTLVVEGTNAAPNTDAGPRQSNGALHGLLAPTAAPSPAPAEFNTARVVVSNGIVEHWINGTRVLSFQSDDPRLAGKAARAAHGAIALEYPEGAMVFRNFRLRSLDTDPPFLRVPTNFTMKEFAEQFGRMVTAGNRAPDPPVVTLAPGQPAVAIAAGRKHSLALLADSTVVGWGFGFERGAAGASSFTRYVPVAERSNIVLIAAGGNTTLLRHRDGSIISWQPNGGQRAIFTPATASERARSISAGDAHWIALGADNRRIIASGVTNHGLHLSRTLPAPAHAVAAGARHNVGISSDGSLFAWGDNRHGQCQPPAGLTVVVSVAGGGEHSLALLNDGRVVAWGRNESGQCDVPAGLRDVMAITAGDRHSLALRRDGTVAMWGSSAQGQGRPPAGLTNVKAIAAGSFHSLALTADGGVVAWGLNESGQASPPEFARRTVIVDPRTGSVTVP